MGAGAVYATDPGAYPCGRFGGRRTRFSVAGMDSSERATIVVIDDDKDYLAFLVALLSRAGYDCQGFIQARKALEHIEVAPAALVVTDIFMPETDGIEVLGAIRRTSPGTPVIALSGANDRYRRIYLEAMQALGATFELNKPIDPARLLGMVESCLRLGKSGSTLS